MDFLKYKEQAISFITYFGIFLGILILTIAVAWLVNRFFSRLIKRSSEDLQSDPTNYQFLRYFVVGVIYMVGFSIAIYQVPDLRALSSSVLAGAGILAVAVGFASQAALSNIISGMFIVVFKPFRINDRLKVQNLEGVVEDITLRHTVIRDFNNKRIIIPNSIISDEIIINSDYQDGKISNWIEVEISYDSDLKLAKTLLREEILKHPLLIDHRNEEDIENGVILGQVRVLAWQDSAILLRGWAWTKNMPDGFVLKCDVLESLKERFDEAGIEIPFPHRTIVFKNSPKNLEK